MDNYQKEETKTQTANKVKFSILADGRVEFDASGLEQYEINDVIAQVASQAKDQRQSAQRIKQTVLGSELVMHCTALVFALIVVSGTSFTISRVVSGAFHQQSGVSNVQR